MNNRWRRVKRLKKAEKPYLSSCEIAKRVNAGMQKAADSSSESFDDLGKALRREMTISKYHEGDQHSLAGQARRLKRAAMEFIPSSIKRHFRA